MVLNRSTGKVPYYSLVGHSVASFIAPFSNCTLPNISIPASQPACHVVTTADSTYDDTTAWSRLTRERNSLHRAGEDAKATRQEPPEIEGG